LLEAAQPMRVAGHDAAQVTAGESVEESAPGTTPDVAHVGLAVEGSVPEEVVQHDSDRSPAALDLDVEPGELCLFLIRAGC
jgi:hypothetical protein